MFITVISFKVWQTLDDTQRNFIAVDYFNEAKLKKKKWNVCNVLFSLNAEAILKQNQNRTPSR